MEMNEVRKIFLEALSHPEFEWKEVQCENPLTKDPSVPGGAYQDGEMVFVIKGRRPPKRQPSVWERLKLFYKTSTSPDR